VEFLAGKHQDLALQDLGRKVLDKVLAEVKKLTDAQDSFK